MLQRRTPLKRTAFARPMPLPREPREERALRPITPRPAGARRAVMAPVSTLVNAVPKQPREECPHLLAMAKGAPCLFWFVDGCRRDYDTGEHCTTVKAHDNRLGANKGKGLKAHDWRSLDACEPCHTAYDQGRKHAREQKNAAFDEAYQRQLAAWRRTASDPLAKPKDREACQWALARYEHNEQRKGNQS